MKEKKIKSFQHFAKYRIIRYYSVSNPPKNNNKINEIIEQIKNEPFAHELALRIEKYIVANEKSDYMPPLFYNTDAYKKLKDIYGKLRKK